MTTIIITMHTRPHPPQKRSTETPRMPSSSATTAFCAASAGTLVTLDTLKSCNRPSSRLMVPRSTGVRFEVGVENEIDTVTVM